MSTDKIFEVIDHTADTGIIVYGANLKQLFSHAAKGLYSQITDLDSIKNRITRTIDLTAPDTESLLVIWLNELLFILDTEHIIFKHCEILDIHENTLQATCRGEKVNFRKHPLQREIKAATYHQLAIEKTNNGYKAQIIFDI